MKILDQYATVYIERVKGRSGDGQIACEKKNVTAYKKCEGEIEREH